MEERALFLMPHQQDHSLITPPVIIAVLKRIYLYYVWGFIPPFLLVYYCYDNILYIVG